MLSQTNLGYTRIAAPEDGIVSERKVRAGQLVSPGTQVLSLVQSDVWVQANYKETQVRHIRPGDPAELPWMLSGIVFKGRSISCPRQPDRIHFASPDNTTGNFPRSCMYR
jgi:membrane fusion protein (multidrug efflux system)